MLTISFVIIGNKTYSEIDIDTFHTIVNDNPNSDVKIGDAGALNFNDLNHLAPSTNSGQFMTVLAGINFSYSMSMNLFPIFSGLRVKTN